MNAIFALLLSSSATFVDEKSNAIAATVNGEEIKLGDVDRVFRLKPKGGPPLTASMIQSLRRAAIDDLVDDVLIRQFLTKQKIVVEPKEVDEQIKVLRESLVKKGETYESYLKVSGYSDAQAREQFASLIGFDKFTAVTGTEAELKKFHDLHKDYFGRVKVHTKLYFVRVPKSEPASTREAAKAKLKALRDRYLKDGFGPAARWHREDSLFEGAEVKDLGWLTQFDSPVEEIISTTAFTLQTKIFSDPIDVESGVALVRCMDRSPTKAVPFDEITDWVRDTYTSQLRKVVLARVRKEATIQITIP